ncbi:MAG TPA: nucleotidyltransferase family protein [Rhodopila sp.]|nr:nucleotidyltransferase family protein [Rhodopila sp.]
MAPENPDHAAELLTLLSRDHHRSHILDLVHALHLPDCWIGAGFIRNAVWDHLHRRPPSKPASDIDVIWFDPHRARPDDDHAEEQHLTELDPDIRWSVKNQCRMHARNDDRPYTSATDALRFWPETATAIAVRRAGETGLEIAAPFGLNDLFALVLRPTPRFAEAKHDIYLERVRNKQWRLTWPRLLPATLIP